MRAFREVADDCSFQDLGWSGAEFTWDNGQAGHLKVKGRLDMAFGNADLMSLFEHIHVMHIFTAESDHCLVLAQLGDHMAGGYQRGA